MGKFSVIVPVYNVENYLEECVESILKQSYQDFELILVNDGSTDKSGLLCDKLAASDNKIIVIHKKNGGLSDARNVGISKAKGDYIIFVDSDDFIELDSLEKFNSEILKANKPDILITLIKQVYEDSEVVYMDSDIPTELFKRNNKKDIVNLIFNKSKNTWPSVRYVVNRNFIIKYNIKFPYGHLHEDVDWTSQIFLFAKSFTCSNFYWYNHRKYHQVLTKSNHPKGTMMLMNQYPQKTLMTKTMKG